MILGQAGPALLDLVGAAVVLLVVGDMFLTIFNYDGFTTLTTFFHRVWCGDISASEWWPYGHTAGPPVAFARAPTDTRRYRAREGWQHRTTEGRLRSVQSDGRDRR